jgi:hypothetical protein
MEDPFADLVAWGPGGVGHKAAAGPLAVLSLYLCHLLT